MKLIVSPFLLFLFFASCIYGQESNDVNMGAVIVAASEGKVSVLDKEDDVTGAETKPGQVIPIGKYILTGAGAKLTLLLSNGTLVTLEESTKMKVGNFQQTPFDGQGQKVSELAGEPSNSKVDLDLEVGSLVLKTKKLRKGSSFNVQTKGGTAGIRGTEFQLAFDPGAGIKLDVTESTVDFTPPGGQPMPVTQGRGLDVSANGQVAPRPVSPAAAQNISNTNQAATEVSADISMDTVAEAIIESTELSQEADMDNQDDGEPQEEPGDEPQEEPMDEPEEAPEESSEEPSTDTEEPTTEPDESSTKSEEASTEPATEPSEEPLATESSTEGDAPVEQEQAATPVEQPAEQEPAVQETASVDIVTEEAPVTEPVTTSQPADIELQDSLPAVDMTPDPVDTPEIVSTLPMTVDDFALQTPKLEVEIKIEEIIERNPDAKQVRETGKLGAPAAELAKLPLDGNMLDEYRDLPEKVQNDLLEVGSELVETIFAVEEINPEQAVEFVNMSPKAQELAVNLKEETLITLLSYDKELQSLAEVEAPVVERLVSLEELDPKIASKFVVLSPEGRESALKLEDSTMVELLEYEPKLQEDMLNLDTPVVERVMSIEEFTPKVATKFVEFTPEAQDLTLGLEDIALVTLLDQDIEEELILSALTPESIEKSSSENIPAENKASTMSEEVLNLGDNLQRVRKRIFMKRLLIWPTVKLMRTG